MRLLQFGHAVATGASQRGGERRERRGRVTRTAAHQAATAQTLPIVQASSASRTALTRLPSVIQSTFEGALANAVAQARRQRARRQRRAS